MAQVQVTMFWTHGDVRELRRSDVSQLAYASRNSRHIITRCPGQTALEKEANKKRRFRVEDVKPKFDLRNVSKPGDVLALLQSKGGQL